jgi:hypothetical protein
MLTGKRSLFVLGLLIAALAGFAYISSHAFAQGKKARTIFVPSTGSPPTLTLKADRSYVMTCAGPDQTSNARVELDAEAISADPKQRGVGYLYHWSIKDIATGRDMGRITGDGKHVVWDLSDLPPGTYNARVDVDTGRAEDCAAFTTTAVRVEPCPPISCPTIVVNCRDAAPTSGPVTFTANISGLSASVRPTYEWTVSAGTIRNGQGTSSIQVDTTGLAGQAIVATLNVLGYDRTCTATCSVQVPLLPLYPKKFDEFPNIKFDDEKARLDNFAIQLQNEPGSRGYILVYSGPRDRAGDAQKRADRARDYLVITRGLDANRIVTILGGQRTAQTVELWLVPNGANPPTPTP